MESKMKIQITELFMAKAGKTGWNRCFHGTIRRERDENDNPVVYGNVKVNEGYILAKANDQWELGEKLDDLVLMILDRGLHNNAGVSFKHNEFDYHLN